MSVVELMAHAMMFHFPQGLFSLYYKPVNTDSKKINDTCLEVHLLVQQGRCEPHTEANAPCFKASTES